MGRSAMYSLALRTRPTGVGAMPQWKRHVEREYLETDSRFVEDILPIGTVDSGSFGLIADATQYILREKDGEVCIRAEVAALEEVINSLSRSGSAATKEDALQAVQRFAEEWEKLIRQRGKWADMVATAREHDEVLTGPADQPRSKRRWWRRN